MAFPMCAEQHTHREAVCSGTNCDGGLTGLEYKRALGAVRQLSQMTLATSWTGGQEVARGMAGWRKSLFATMHLNANLPAAYFGVPAAQVVEVGLEVEI